MSTFSLNFFRNAFLTSRLSHIYVGPRANWRSLECSRGLLALFRIKANSSKKHEKGVKERGSKKVEEKRGREEGVGVCSKGDRRL